MGSVMILITIIAILRDIYKYTIQARYSFFLILNDGIFFCLEMNSMVAQKFGKVLGFMEVGSQLRVAFE